MTNLHDQRILKDGVYSALEVGFLGVFFVNLIRVWLDAHFLSELTVIIYKIMFLAL